MPKVILDTDILSEYLKGIDPNVAKHATTYAKKHGAFTFTSVTVYEIIRGLEEKGAPRQVEKALAWIEQNEQAVPTAEDYLTAARVKAKAKHQGKALELPDCLIAAVAARLGLPLATGNTSDYKAIQDTGLAFTLKNWRKP